MVRKVDKSEGPVPNPPKFSKEVSLFVKNLAVRLTSAALNKLEGQDLKAKEKKPATMTTLKKHSFQVDKDSLPKRKHQTRIALPGHLHPGLAKPLNHRVTTIDEFSR